LTTLRLILRSLRFHARSHLGTLAGASVASAVLIGALAVGDSVRGTLREMALARLGKIEFALASGDRLFRPSLGPEVQASLTQAGYGQGAPVPVAALLELPGVATSSDGTARANHVQVFGVDNRFWELASRPVSVTWISPDAVVLNQPLAKQLGARVGDDVVLRVRKPSHLSRDAPLAPEEEATLALRVRVQAVVGDEALGRFSLQAGQLPPLNAFVGLPYLQTRAGATNRANLLLVGQPGERTGVVMGVQTVRGASPQPFGQPFGPPVNLLAGLRQTLRLRWQPEDAQLEWRELPAARALELRSSRVFLDPAVGDAVFGASGITNAVAPRLAIQMPFVKAGGVLTYLVNELRVGERTTPYSMVAAIGPPFTPPDLREDEVLINQWLADDLAAKPGDELTLTYYVVGAMRQFEERSARFRIRDVLPMNAAGLDRTLMPDFPGLVNAKSCRDWDTGLPIQLDHMRDKDQRYWEQFAGTPKALVSLAAGQRLWTNRFGNLTAIRFYAAGQTLAPVQPANRPDQARFLMSQRYALSRMLAEAMDPAAVGLNFQPVRAQALAASAGSQDFGQLFLGFSFFLIAAALLLMAVLFQFGIEKRAVEVGTLLALGFSPRQVMRVLLFEGGLLAGLGALLGWWGGVWYARAMLHGLSTVWNQAVGGINLRYHSDPMTLAGGVTGAIVLAMFVMWLALRRQVRLPAQALLSGGASAAIGLGAPRAGKPSRGWFVGGAGLLFALGLVAWAVARRELQSAGLFFGAGTALLVAGLGFGAAWLARLAVSESAARLSLAGMGLRAATRRRKRSLAVMALLACGSFLIASMGVFRLEAVRGADQRSSGTGGFALIGESTQPVIHDLNSAKGRDAYGLGAASLAGVAVVPFRVRDGEDASCLNLNRAQQPRLLGVRPDLLQERGAFTFVQAAKGLPADQRWLLLRRSAGDTAIPAIGDQASILWALGKKVGDTLDYTDEHGARFQLRLVGAVANSILQGSLVIAEDEFVARFPTATGYRMFLLDAPSNSVAAVSKDLGRALSDLGLELTPAVDRLASLNAVQNTYLGTFQVLGGLGLILGSVGLGVVVLRNVLERRGELALLLAVGFRPRALNWLVLSEHAALLAGGLGLGVAAALVAVGPALLAPGAHVPHRSLGLTLGGVLLNGSVWTWLATLAALRGRLLDALRNE
jgi:ABC-type antimicrobial peptide transport system permease subunit